MIDPPTVDITGRILEMLASYGYTRRDKRVEKAMQFILREQEPDGSWFGRWGVNYLYGTFLVLRGLEAMEYVESWSRRCSRRRSGFAWCRTPMAAGARRAGRTTIRMQTGHWAVARRRRRRGRCWGCWRRAIRGRDSVAKGIRWLIERQHEDGSWDELMPGRNGESYYTGTGFPRVFYLGYHLYSSISRCWR